MRGGFDMELNLYTLALAVLATCSGFVLGDIHMDLASHVSSLFQNAPSLQVDMKS